MLPLRDSNPTRRFPLVTIVLIAINVGVYFFVQPGTTGAMDEGSEAEQIEFVYEYAAIPCELTEFEPLTLEEARAGLRGDAEGCGRSGPLVFPGKNVVVSIFVSMFLHAGLFHLGGNMLFLWIFGNNVEDHLGRLRYVLFYLAGGFVATLAHVALRFDDVVPIIGASGAVAAVMGAYLMWFPRAGILTLVVVIPVPGLPAWLVLGVWFLSQFAIDPTSGVAWMAHVGGFVFGVLVGWWVRSSRAARRRMWTPQYTQDVGTRWDDRAGGTY